MAGQRTCFRLLLTNLAQLGGSRSQYIKSTLDLHFPPSGLPAELNDSMKANRALSAEFKKTTLQPMFNIHRAEVAWYFLQQMSHSLSSPNPTFLVRA